MMFTFDRRPVNSTVMLLHPTHVRILVLITLALTFVVVANAQTATSRREAPRVLRYIQPPYPIIAASRRASGAVLVDVDINSKGDVTDARAITGDKLLREPARKAALGWKFNTTDDVAARTVRLTFIFHETSYVAPEKKPEFTSPYQIEIEWTAEFDDFGKHRRRAT